MDAREQLDKQALQVYQERQDKPVQTDGRDNQELTESPVRPVRLDRADPLVLQDGQDQQDPLD